MSTKHIATAPDGTTFKRTSQNRVYPFAVAVSPATKAERIAELRTRIEHAEGWAAKHVEIVEYLTQGGEVQVLGSTGWETLYAVGLKPTGSMSGNERNLGMRRVGLKATNAEEALAEESKYVESYQQEIAGFLAQIAEEEAGPEFTGTWRVSGWQSRDDLAQKEQARIRAAHTRFPREVAILTATISQ